MIKNFKLYILQYKYKNITDLILKLQKHIDYLFINNYIDFLQKNHILSNIFLISKKLNLSYNKYITDEININDKLSLKLYEFLTLFENESNDKIIFNKILPIINNFNDDLPLISYENEIINIISDCGLESIDDLLRIYNNKFKLSEKQNRLIEEINRIFVPTKIKYFDVANTNKVYYWRKPNFFNDNDLLKLTREIWIKNNDSDTEYIKIEGYFMNDSLSCFIKTSQLNYNILQKRKNNILKKIANKNIDPNFIKKFIRYDYLGNIYTMGCKEYIRYIDEAYKKFTDISSMTFINIMTNFISKDSDIQTMFKFIFYYY